MPPEFSVTANHTKVQPALDSIYNGGGRSQRAIDVPATKNTGPKNVASLIENTQTWQIRNNSCYIVFCWVGYGWRNMLRELNPTGGIGAKPANSTPESYYQNVLDDRFRIFAMNAYKSKKPRFAT